MNYSKQSIRHRAKSLEAKGIKIRNKIGLWVGKIVLACILVAMVVIISSAIGVWKGIIDSAPDISEIDVTPTGYSTTVYDADGNEISTLVAAGANRKYVTIEEIPEDLQHAFVAIEDERFYDHNGIDITGIIRAFFVGVSNGGFSEGASTITQQLIKNNVLTTWTSETSLIEKFQRKIQEQYLAVELEKLVDDKQWILENYLNSINLGSNTLGVEAASLKYFNKDVSELTLSECAVIAGITQNPSAYNPIRHPENNAKRREKVLGNMLEQGYITQAQYEEAMADNVYDRIAEYNTGDGTSVNSYFVDAMIDDVYDDLVNELGYSESEAYKALYQGGLEIYSTQDPSIQTILDEEINDEENYYVDTQYSFSMSFQVKYDDGTYKTFTHQTMLAYYQKSNSDADINYSSEEDASAAIEKYKEIVLEDGGSIVEGTESVYITLQPQAAATIIDNETGYVVALTGGRGEKEGNRTLNRATDVTRQPGSTFKIIGCYAAALDAGGKTLASVQDDAPFKVGDKSYRNWDNSYSGFTTIRDAITDSMNIVTVKNLQDIGVELAYSYAEKLGITTLVDQDKNLGLALGGLTNGVTNLELTAAYATIANGGTYRTPKFYTKVVDHEGNVLLDASETQESHQALKETTAWLLTSAMEDVMTEGSGTAAYFGDSMAQAGKTGTTTSNRDTLLEGYTPYYTCGIWGGFDDNAVQSYTQYTKTLWKAIMSRVHEGLEYKDFEKPAGIVEAKVCAKSGLLPVENVCDHDQRGSMVITEYFEEGTVPTETCSTHIALDICTTSGLIANMYCPSDKVKHLVFVTGAEDGSGEGEYNIDEAFLAGTCDKHKKTETETQTQTQTQENTEDNSTTTDEPTSEDTTDDSSTDENTDSQDSDDTGDE